MYVRSAIELYLRWIDTTRNALTSMESKNWSHSTTVYVSTKKMVTLFGRMQSVKRCLKYALPSEFWTKTKLSLQLTKRYDVIWYTMSKWRTSAGRQDSWQEAIWLRHQHRTHMLVWSHPNLCVSPWLWLLWRFRGQDGWYWKRLSDRSCFGKDMVCTWTWVWCWRWQASYYSLVIVRPHKFWCIH
jgi:hypothetical protein